MKWIVGIIIFFIVSGLFDSINKRLDDLEKKINILLNQDEDSN